MHHCGGGSGVVDDGVLCLADGVVCEAHMRGAHLWTWGLGDQRGLKWMFWGQGWEVVQTDRELAVMDCLLRRLTEARLTSDVFRTVRASRLALAFKEEEPRKPVVVRNIEFLDLQVVLDIMTYNQRLSSARRVVEVKSSQVKLPWMGSLQKSAPKNA